MIGLNSLVHLFNVGLLIIFASVLAEFHYYVRVNLDEQFPVKWINLGYW